MNRCFYCGDETHTIKECVNPEILRLYESIKNIYLTTRVIENTIMRQRYFIYGMRQISFDAIISVALKYTNVLYPNSVAITDEHYILALWYNFENIYLAHRDTLINDLVDNANVYFINGPTATNNSTLQPLVNQHPVNQLQIVRQRSTRRYHKKQHNFIVTIETEKYTNDQKEECSICLDEVKCLDFVKLGCDHKFCVKCVIKNIKINPKDNYTCALCRCETELMRVYDTYTYNLVKEL